MISLPFSSTVETLTTLDFQVQNRIPKSLQFLHLLNLLSYDYILAKAKTNSNGLTLHESYIFVRLQSRIHLTFRKYNLHSTAFFLL